ncbi:MAG TPA: response regulator [Gemmataceae bacterium]|nr:response regulator [Gemmataceae bacterium]
MTPTKKHCLLVVDDEPDVCDSVHDLLRHEFKVLKAPSAVEGARLMGENEVHIIMTDQRMPSVSGVDLLKNIRHRHPLSIRLLFTGFADLEAIIEAINHGHIFKFVKKPWQPDDLLAVVREAAQEYDRLVKQDEELVHLRAELERLRQRVTVLEQEVARLRGA